MKTIKFLAVALFCGAIVLTSESAMAQKFGHVNSQEVIALMPERDSALIQMQKYGKDLQDTQEAMAQDFNTKLKAYNANKATWTMAILEVKEKELTDLQQRIEQFRNTAQQDFQQRQQTLLAPIMEKAQKAIDKVAKAKGLIYVFDISGEALLYIDDTQSDNILPAVKAELGIPASKTQPTPIGEEASSTAEK